MEHKLKRVRRLIEEIHSHVSRCMDDEELQRIEDVLCSVDQRVMDTIDIIHRREKKNYLSLEKFIEHIERTSPPIELHLVEQRIIDFSKRKGFIPPGSI